MTFPPLSPTQQIRNNHFNFLTHHASFFLASVHLFMFNLTSSCSVPLPQMKKVRTDLPKENLFCSEQKDGSREQKT